MKIHRSSGRKTIARYCQRTIEWLLILVLDLDFLFRIKEIGLQLQKMIVVNIHLWSGHTRHISDMNYHILHKRLRLQFRKFDHDSHLITSNLAVILRAQLTVRGPVAGHNSIDDRLRLIIHKADLLNGSVGFKVHCTLAITIDIVFVRNSEHVNALVVQAIHRQRNDIHRHKQSGFEEAYTEMGILRQISFHTITPSENTIYTDSGRRHTARAIRIQRPEGFVIVSNVCHATQLDAGSSSNLKVERLNIPETNRHINFHKSARLNLIAEDIGRSDTRQGHIVEHIGTDITILISLSRFHIRRAIRRTWHVIRRARLTSRQKIAHRILHNANMTIKIEVHSGLNTRTTISRRRDRNQIGNLVCANHSVLFGNVQHLRRVGHPVVLAETEADATLRRELLHVQRLLEIVQHTVVRIRDNAISSAGRLAVLAALHRQESNLITTLQIVTANLKIALLLSITSRNLPVLQPIEHVHVHELRYSTIQARLVTIVSKVASIFVLTNILHNDPPQAWSRQGKWSELIIVQPRFSGLLTKIIAPPNLFDLVRVITRYDDSELLIHHQTIHASNRQRDFSIHNDSQLIERHRLER